MRMLIRSVQHFPRSVVNPLNSAGLPLFFILALLPSILHLTFFHLLVTNPLVALGPVTAGFWFAASRREIRVNFALLGTLITTLLWMVNWLMLAGHTCCSTMH